MFIGDAFMRHHLGPEKFKEWRKAEKQRYQDELAALRTFAPGVWHPADTHPGTFAKCFVLTEGKSIQVSYGPGAGGDYWYNEYGNGGLSYYYREPDPGGGKWPIEKSRALKITHWQRWPEPPMTAIKPRPAGDV